MITRAPALIHILLASGSPFRRELLEQAGYLVTVRTPGIPEPQLHTHSLTTAIVELARAKSEAVTPQTGDPDIIVAADTVSLVEGEILGKPVDRDEARRMLRSLSGSVHEVVTGFCLRHRPSGESASGVVSTRLSMRTWTSQQIETYLDSNGWIGKCGAYGLETESDPFVERLEGSYSNVIGLPLENIAAELRSRPNWWH